MGQKRWVILLVVVLLSFVIPAALCGAVALLEARSIVALAVGCVAAGSWLALVALVNWWEFTSRWLAWAWCVAFAGVVALRVHAARRHDGDAVDLSFPLECGRFLVTDGAFGSDRPYGLGNHVVIRKGADQYVVLGHMREGTVVVKPGDEVRAGQEIGRVGNSGWTERPHLHMQAMRSAKGDWRHGDPLPLCFAGRFLVRNQSIRT
jgi:hypothetical protein